MPILLLFSPLRAVLWARRAPSQLFFFVMSELVMECYNCDEDMSDQTGEGRFASYVFCDECLYKIEVMGKLRCGSCAVAITTVELYEDDVEDDGEGTYWCGKCVAAWGCDWSSHGAQTWFSCPPPLEQGRFTSQGAAIDAIYADTFEDESDDAEDEGEEAHGTIRNAAECRARNLRDLARLKRHLPGYCSHHVLYYHVLEAVSRGCTSAVDTNGCCMAGGRPRSHDFPDGLESIGLEALDTTA